MTSFSACSAARDALSAREDGELGEQDAVLLEQHLASCAPCRAHGRALARLAPRLAELRAPAAPPAELWARLERRLPPARAPRRAPPVLARAAAALLGFAGASAFALAFRPAAAPGEPHALERLFAGASADETQAFLASLPELRLLRHR